MNAKLLAYIVASAGFAACCLGIPVLIVVLSSGAGAAWLGDNGFPLAAIGAAAVGVVILVRRTPRRAAPFGSRDTETRRGPAWRHPSE